MSKYKIEFTRRAYAQIRNIFQYTAQDDKAAALKMVDTIEEKVYMLASSPHMGLELSKENYPFLAPGYRRLVVKPFLIYYRMIEQTIFITHIVHGRQHQQNALQD